MANAHLTQSLVEIDNNQGKYRFLVWGSDLDTVLDEAEANEELSDCEPAVHGPHIRECYRWSVAHTFEDGEWVMLVADTKTPHLHPEAQGAVGTLAFNYRRPDETGVEVMFGPYGLEVYGPLEPGKEGWLS